MEKTLYGPVQKRDPHPEKQRIQDLIRCCRDAAEEGKRVLTPHLEPQPGLMTEHEMQFANWIDAIIRVGISYRQARDERLAREKEAARAG